MQILALPIISKSGDFTSPAPVIVFTPEYGSNHAEGPKTWSKSIAFGDKFRMIHDLKYLPKSNGELDMVVVAGREGITLLWFDRVGQHWSSSNINEGLTLADAGNTVAPFLGCGGVEICPVGEDYIGYIATVEVSMNRRGSAVTHIFRHFMVIWCVSISKIQTRRRERNRSSRLPIGLALSSMITPLIPTGTRAHFITWPEFIWKGIVLARSPWHAWARVRGFLSGLDSRLTFAVHNSHQE